MDTNALRVLKLFAVGILVNSVVTNGLSATESLETAFTQRPREMVCNETILLLEMEGCGDHFKTDMASVDPRHWCNLTHFIKEYNSFSDCTERNAMDVGCFWPNPLVESYIIRIHKQFFSNCTLERVVLVDPPEDTLTILILIPVLLTLAMIALVVWCSKRSDTFS
ncbi:receptor activity-modifying protein 3 [Chanos chanos]|uniref:Receptor activity-modifying protein 3 n=1 Tax=Chanos chanos TaxID=29144 RepID=A0A6J2V0S9_CHACN|nr:receptor activity-modifying protein 3 [Chanos chanos]